jgi:hypothetical protein
MVRQQKIKYVDDTAKISLEEFLKTKKIIYKFVRNEHGHPYGVICAIGRNAVGWSKVHWIDEGIWNKEDGLAIAIRRAMKPHKKPLSPVFKNLYDEMTERSTRYFKE